MKLSILLDAKNCKEIPRQGFFSRTKKELLTFLTDDGEAFVATWSTFNFTQARVRVGLNPFDLTTKYFGDVVAFEDLSESEVRIQYLHTVTIKPIQHGEIHCNFTFLILYFFCQTNSRITFSNESGH